MVTVDERGAPDGARLVRVDAEGEPPVKLTPVQYGLLRRNAVLRAAVKLSARPYHFNADQLKGYAALRSPTPANAW
jgi:hypothetical protein